MDALPLRYGRVEAALAELYGVAPRDRGAFKGRIRALRKVDVPLLPRVGTGIQIDYSFLHAVEMLIGLELVQAQLDPSAISILVRGARWELSSHVDDVLTANRSAEFHLGYFLSAFGGDVTPERLTYELILRPRSDFFELAFNDEWFGKINRLLIMRFGELVWRLKEILEPNS